MFALSTSASALLSAHVQPRRARHTVRRQAGAVVAADHAVEQPAAFASHQPHADQAKTDVVPTSERSTSRSDLAASNALLARSSASLAKSNVSLAETNSLLGRSCVTLAKKNALLVDQVASLKRQLDAVDMGSILDLPGGKRAALLTSLAVEPTVCTYINAGPNDYVKQDWYFCRTCGQDGQDNKGFCTVCAKHCHAGHDIVHRARSPCYCDCGAGEEPRYPACNVCPP
ncbi:hypothetical protein WJX72_003359 [[Myrmecia] bisecta]|uniref:UBR-type domain-containing protein n=1 Tax=[Myrmecia] bisecta TaxID=41462 RepID=A0AAW1QQJ2_9CHLO